MQFSVIGVLESKGQGGGFNNPDDQVLIPLQTGRYRLLGGDRLRSINLLAPSEKDIPVTMAEIEKIMRRQHRLRPGQADDFTIRNQSDFLSTLGETTQVFTWLLAGIAAVSLLVGGIGIMNIMLVSVTERTREIGVRKALGATQVNILLQFLIEALVLCMLGGVIGIASGTGAAGAAAQDVPVEHRRGHVLGGDRVPVRGGAWGSCSACGRRAAPRRSIPSSRCATSSAWRITSSARRGTIVAVTLQPGAGTYVVSDSSPPSHFLGSGRGSGA